jgi:Zn-dependent peptidase ImmA (M78 family)
MSMTHAITFHNYPLHLLKKYNLIDYPVDLDAICRKEGIAVNRALPFERFDDWHQNKISGEIRTLPEHNQTEIWINPLEPECRQRFTLAHELGHYYLDLRIKANFQDTETTLFRSAHQDPIEHRANLFAAKLLMPKPFIEHEIKRLKIYQARLDVKTIQQLAQSFAVSHSAMTKRLQHVGFLQTP